MIANVDVATSLLRIDTVLSIISFVDSHDSRWKVTEIIFNIVTLSRGTIWRTNEFSTFEVRLNRQQILRISLLKRKIERKIIT